MKRYDSNDLFSVMESLVNKDVEGYREDLDIDKESILRHYTISSEKDFIWLTRDQGTDCGFAPTAFISNCWLNAVCRMNLSSSTTKPYFIHIDEVSDEGTVKGSIYPLNRKKLLEDVEKHSVPAAYVKFWKRPT